VSSRHRYRICRGLGARWTLHTYCELRRGKYLSSGGKKTIEIATAAAWFIWMKQALTGTHTHTLSLSHTHTHTLLRVVSLLWVSRLVALPPAARLRHGYCQRIHTHALLHTHTLSHALIARERDLSFYPGRSRA